MKPKSLTGKIIFQVLLLCAITQLTFSQKLEYFEHLKDSSTTLLEKMDDPYTMVLSPDDRYLYVSAYMEKTLLLFERTTAGELQWRATYQNDVDGNQGLNAINALTISPDGKSLYIAAGNTLAVYNRDQTSGKINFSEIHQDGVNGVDGLWMNVNVIVSNDNKFVYTVGFRDHAVAVFARDLFSGQLTYVQHRSDGIDDVEGLYQAIALAMSPDDKHLYVVGQNSSLTVFEKEASSGIINFVDSYIHHGWVSDFLDVPPTAIALSGTGDFVYISSEDEDALRIFARDAATGKLSLVQAVEKEFSALAALEAPSSLSISADGKYLYVGSYVQSTILVFEIDPTTGMITHKENITHPTSLFASSFRLSKDGLNIYQTNLDESLLSVYTTSPTEGVYEWSVDYKNLDKTVHIEGLQGAKFILTTPDGKHIYVLGSDEHSLSLYNRNHDGTLTFVQAYKSTTPGLESLENSVGVEISPDENFVVVISAVGNHLTVFARDAASGLLTDPVVYTNGEGGIVGMTYPSAVAFSADGAHIYVASFLGNDGGGVVVFDRDVHTGGLTYLETYKNGVEGMKLSNACNIRISADDKYVYVLANGDNAVNVFSRTPSTGLLTLLNVYQNGTEDIEEMVRPNYLHISPDGRSLYITSYISNSVVMFSIDKTTGALTYGASYANGRQGIEYLQRPENCFMDPSGNYLFVSSASGVHTFICDPATGLLEYYDLLIDEEVFLSASFVVVSKEGDFLYLASADANTLSSWAIVRLPEAPTGLVAEAVDETIELHWQTSLAPSDIMQYIIYRSTDPSVHTATIIGTALQNNYQDASVEANTIYYYWVTLVHSNGSESIWSEPDTAVLLTTDLYADISFGSLLAYPNPTSDQVKIVMSDPSLQQIEIYNQQLQLVRSVSVHHFLRENSIDLSMLPSGVYMVKFVGASSSKIVRVSKR